MGENFLGSTGKLVILLLAAAILSAGVNAQGICDGKPILAQTDALTICELDDHTQNPGERCQDVAAGGFWYYKIGIISQSGGYFINQIFDNPINDCGATEDNRRRGKYNADTFPAGESEFTFYYDEYNAPGCGKMQDDIGAKDNDEGIMVNIIGIVFNWPARCTAGPVCGDGTITPPEECESAADCDDGNPATKDTCPSCRCKHKPVSPSCGNGQVEPPEQCEYASQCNDNNPATTDSCNSCTCTHTTSQAVCGDGLITPPEQCEQNANCNDNNPATLDTCLGCRCFYETTGFCGNGVIEGNEQCEPKSSNNNQFCEQEPKICQGTKTGVRDANGYCGSSCNCIPDNFQFACIEGSCGATCDSNSDCNDNNPGTRDSCSGDCGCIHEDVPYCGNNRLDPGEQCEDNGDCSPGKICQDCLCRAGPYCGDANVDGGEQCDYGVAVNGVPCVPPTNGTCNYCQSNCTWKTLSGGGCGNFKIEYNEECDEGTRNGVLCSPRCGDYCIYCQNTCKIGYVPGDDCQTNNTIPPPVPCPTCHPSPNIPPYPCGGPFCPPPILIETPKAGICGDGLVSFGEDCDFGADNGMACVPACNGDCAYCSADCKKVIREGGVCVRTARPWDPIVSNPCKTFIFEVKEARLDESCGGFSKVVTGEVNVSDNKRAAQQACLQTPSYIYFKFENVAATQGLRNLSFMLEHVDYNDLAKVEYYNGSHWVYQCTIAKRAREYTDSCTIKGIKDFRQVSLRLSVSREKKGAEASVDHAYLVGEYCAGFTTCGNGVVDPYESCDDGNLVAGDGCDEMCGKEYLLCAEWGECLGGKQTQLCYYGNLLKNNVRYCGGIVFFENFLVIFLIFLLILLVLLFLFFPMLFATWQKRKNKKKPAQ